LTGRETLEQRIEALGPGLEIHRPPGRGPFPVVVQLHGCGGKKPLQGRWAAAAREAGWAAVVVDSYRHRRISQLEAYSMVCTGLKLWGRERAGDAYAALAWARRQAWCDADCLALAGWSHGGWTALDAMALQPGREMEAATGLLGLPAEPLAGLRGAFLVYPFAGPGSLARARGLRVDASVMAVVGTHDVIVGGHGLGRALSAMRVVGRPIEVRMFEGATHAFDEPEAHDLRVRHDPDLTAEAQRLYGEHLRALREAAPIARAAG
jgi:dienelactone hydrolase